MHKITTWNALWCLLIVTLAVVAEATPLYQSIPGESYRSGVEVEDPEAVLEMLTRLGQSILKAKHDNSNAKRGLDLGLGRGFSGSQAAKHIMGLAAANFASGPGKRKRMEGVLEYPNAAAAGGYDSGLEWYNNGRS